MARIFDVLATSSEDHILTNFSLDHVQGKFESEEKDWIGRTIEGLENIFRSRADKDNIIPDHVTLNTPTGNRTISRVVTGKVSTNEVRYTVSSDDGQVSLNCGFKYNKETKLIVELVNRVDFKPLKDEISTANFN